MSKEHAWKSTLLARAEAHQNAPTHLQINDFRNIDAGRRVLVNRHVGRRFDAVCDTVLTQFVSALLAIRFCASSVRESRRGPHSVVGSCFVMLRSRCFDRCSNEEVQHILASFPLVKAALIDFPPGSPLRFLAHSSVFGRPVGARAISRSCRH